VPFACASRTVEPTKAISENPGRTSPSARSLGRLVAGVACLQPACRGGAIALIKRVLRPGVRSWTGVFADFVGQVERLARLPKFRSAFRSGGLF
jgi:hypothetical protein